MELGKWIVFAFLLGAVLVGFKSRQLKAYEFIVCGLFAVLLDGLIFHGAISQWIGELGKNAKDAISAPHLGNLPGLAALGAIVPISAPRLRQYAAACWLHRPDLTDVLVVAVCAAVLAGMLNLSVPVTGLVFAATLAAFTIVATFLDPEFRAVKRLYSRGTNRPRTTAKPTAEPSTGTATPDDERGRRDG